MQFNPTDKAISIIADIDFILFGDGETLNTDYSLTDRTRNVNIVWDEAVAELYKADPNHRWDDTTNTTLPCATLDLISGRDHYTLLDTALVVHSLRMKNSNGDLQKLTPILRRELSDSELASVGSPSKYYKIGGVLFPIPVPNYAATDGIEFWFQRGANHFTIASTTAAPGFNPQFHHFLSVGAALRYAIANGMSDKIKQLRADKEAIRQEIEEHYQTRSPDEKPKFRLKRKSVNSYGL